MYKQTENFYVSYPSSQVSGNAVHDFNPQPKRESDVSLSEFTNVAITPPKDNTNGDLESVPDYTANKYKLQDDCSNESKPLESKHRKSKCRWTKLITAIIIIIIIIIIVALSVTLSINDSDDEDRKRYVAEMTVRVYNQTFQVEMSNTSSEEFKNFQNSFCGGLYVIYATKSEFGEYRGCTVVSLKNGSIVTDFNLYFISRDQISSDKLKQAVTEHKGLSNGVFILSTELFFYADNVSVKNVRNDIEESEFRPAVLEKVVTTTTVPSGSSTDSTSQLINSGATSAAHLTSPSTALHSMNSSIPLFSQIGSATVANDLKSSTKQDFNTQSVGVASSLSGITQVSLSLTSILSSSDSQTTMSQTFMSQTSMSQTSMSQTSISQNKTPTRYPTPTLPNNTATTPYKTPTLSSIHTTYKTPTSPSIHTTYKTPTSPSIHTTYKNPTLSSIHTTYKTPTSPSIHTTYKNPTLAAMNTTAVTPLNSTNTTVYMTPPLPTTRPYITPPLASTTTKITPPLPNNTHITPPLPTTKAPITPPLSDTHTTETLLTSNTTHLTPTLAGTNTTTSM